LSVYQCRFVGGQSECQPGDIERRVPSVSIEVSERYFKKIGKHDGNWGLVI
jgi:hypothetical protein